jgi:hypothetical protein
VFLITAVPLAGVPGSLRDADVPGAAIAQAYGGRAFGVTVGLLTVASTLALIFAEYLALARLLRFLHGHTARSLLGWIAVPFIAADAISLVNPNRFYYKLLTPSLAGLYVSQLLVFLVFRRYRLGPLAAAASGLVVWGLYTLFGGGTAT